MKTVPCTKCSRPVAWEDDEEPKACDYCVMASLPDPPDAFAVTFEDETILVAADSMSAALAAWRSYRKAIGEDCDGDEPESIRRAEGWVLTPAYLAIVEDAFLRREPA